MTENDQTLDAFDAAEPGAQPLNGRVIDRTVPGEGGHGCGHEASEIDG